MAQVDDWMTVSAWAASHDMTRQAGHAAVRRCNIPRRAEDGKVSRVEADALYLAKTRAYAKKSAKAGPAAAQAPEGEHVTYQEAKRREAVARAIMAERELAEQAGELVRVGLVRDTWGRLLGEAKARLLNMPSRLAPLVHAVSQQQAHEAIRREVFEVLTDLSRSDGAPR